MLFVLYVYEYQQQYFEYCKLCYVLSRDNFHSVHLRYEIKFHAKISP